MGWKGRKAAADPIQRKKKDMGALHVLQIVMLFGLGRERNIVPNCASLPIRSQKGPSLLLMLNGIAQQPMKWTLNNNRSS